MITSGNWKTQISFTLDGEKGNSTEILKGPKTETRLNECGDNLFLGVLGMSRDEELAKLEGFFDKRDTNQDEIDYLNSLFGEEKRSQRFYRRSPLSTRWQ